ncbi:MAG: tetratricopeptide repeat protein [Myxococcales bacterium]
MPEQGEPAAPGNLAELYASRMAAPGDGPAAPRPAGSWRLVALVSLVALAIASAFGFRAWQKRKRIREAARNASAALARDTYGGFRDADLALRDLVGPSSPEHHLALERAYALAELAARYGDDQAGVEAKLLTGPIEIAVDKGNLALPAEDLSRLYASDALVALGEKAPGDAIVALGKVPEEQSSAELLVVKAQADAQDENAALAKAALDGALRRDPELPEALDLQAQVARSTHRPADAIALYQRILARNPTHVPSLLALAEMAVAAQGDPAAAAAGIDRVLAQLPSEGSPDEQCRALLALVRLDLSLGHAVTAPSHLDRAGDLEDAPASCQVELARLDQRLGRQPEALALLKKAATADDPGDAPLWLGEATDDPRAALKLSKTEVPPDLTLAQKNAWGARAAGIAVRADLALGQRKAAAALADALSVETVPGMLGTARLRAGLGERAAALRALGEAFRIASRGPEAADALADVGETALAVGAPNLARAACDDAASAPGNFRALFCAARALHALGKTDEARQRLDRALLVNPSAPGVGALRAELSPPPAPALGATP